MACRDCYRLQAYYGIGSEVTFHFAAHARGKGLCRFLVRAYCRMSALGAKTANFFRHSQAYKVIQRNPFLARQKLGPFFQ